MSKQINLDDVFRSGLNSHQEPFDEGAWLHMQQKLTADAVKPKFWLAYLNKKTINILLTMFLFTASVTAAFLLQANTRILPIQPASSQIITDNNFLNLGIDLYKDYLRNEIELLRVLVSCLVILQIVQKMVD